MSTIYLATCIGAEGGLAGRKVVIKRVAVAGLPDPDRIEASKWLAREAGLLSSLKYPHLPALIAAFSEGDSHYVVMPYLPGETLLERVRRQGPQLEVDVLRWARELIDTLAYLHAQTPPIIHRDIKPDNILVGSRERPRFSDPNFDPSSPDFEQAESLVLLDLGVARPQMSGLPGTAVGTPGYAPPEQYQGLADERSDLYALGATLHYLLTGYDADLHTPFRHPSVHDLRSGVSPPLEQLVADLLQVVPAQRPGSAQEVRARLEAITVDVWNPRLRDAAKARELYVGAMQASWQPMFVAGRLADTLQAGRTPGYFTMFLGVLALGCIGLYTGSALSVKPDDGLARKARLRTLAVVLPSLLIATPAVAFAQTAAQWPVLVAIVLAFVLLGVGLWKAGAEYKSIRLLKENEGNLGRILGT